MSRYNNLDELFKSMDKKLGISKEDQNEIQSKVNQNLNTRRNALYFSKFKYHLALAVAGVIFFILAAPLVLPLFTDFSNDGAPGQVPQGDSISTDGEVETIAYEYAKALETHDIPSMVKYSDDLRFNSEDEQMEQYLKIEQNITDASVLSLTKINEDNYEVIIEVIQNEEVIELTFPIYKKDGEWRILVGQDL